MKIMKRNVIYSFLVMSLIIMTACKKNKTQEDFTSAKEYDSEVVTEWYALIKTLTTETPGYTPPVAARAFGYTGVALYEAVQYGISDKVSLSGKLSELNVSVEFEEYKEYHWPTVANVALAEMTKYFYKHTSVEKYNEIIALEAKYANQFQDEIDNAEVYVASILLAKEVTEKIIAWSETDGGLNCHLNNFPASYTPMVGDQYWRPTAPDFSPALQPYWGNNRPFLAINVETSIPELPPVYSTDPESMFYERAMEVYNTVNEITPEQVVIAEFWSDDPVTTATPPGHSISVLNQLIKKNGLNLAESVEAFAKLGIGVSDAFICCWKTKYETNYLRPITYINDNIDAAWTTILPTPPFPEYTSGHSVQSGALAEIMTNIFGDNQTFVDHTHEGRTDIDGSPRTYSSFYEMAEEAAMSRLYGGIHYHEAIFVGLDQGYKIGENVNNLNLNN